MKIKNKLILIYLGIISVLLSFFCFVIYIQSENHRKEEFRERLKIEAVSTANIFFTKKDISPDILKLLDKNNFTALINEEIVIVDESLNVVYETGNDKFVIEPQKIKLIMAEKEAYWEKGDFEFFGILLENNQKPYYVISYALDKYGIIKLKNLAYVLVFGGLSILVLSVLTGWFYVKRMLDPIQQIIKKIDKIKASQLSERLEVGQQNDEFTQLTQRFNQMLDRLQKAFLSQKAFVSHASHELRTPLTSITGQIQVSLLADDSPEDLKKMINSVLEDVQQLNKLSNNLLDLTSISSGSQEVNFLPINILDKISRVRDEVMKKNPQSQIYVNFSEEYDEIPDLQGNAPLLYTALFNLFENGVKYSPNQKVEVKVLNNATEVILEIKNISLPLKDEDYTAIFEPFKRGSNSRSKKGHGVGLPLVKGIIDMHGGKIELESSELNTILFTVKLPKANSNTFLM